MRNYLVFCSSGPGGPVSDLFGPDRLYDVALHHYGPVPSPGTFEAEYQWNIEGREKLNAAAELMTAPMYDAVAFLDDDLSFDTDSLNRAFLTGHALGLDIWQPSLTADSFGSHPFLWQRRYNEDTSRSMIDRGVRRVPFVEIMMPFFSRRVIADALKTFDINESGWGMDVYMWPKIAQGYVLDGVAFGHYREPGRRDRILRNGLTCWQELWIQKRIHDPKPENFYPPGYVRPIE